MHQSLVSMQAWALTEAYLMVVELLRDLLIFRPSMGVCPKWKQVWA